MNAVGRTIGALVIVLCACSDPTPPPSPGPPVSMQLLTTPNVTITTMHVFPVRIRVSDATGRAVPNVGVVFETWFANGLDEYVTRTDTVLTDANGEAGIEAKLGPVTGHYVIFPEVIGPSPVVDRRQRADATVTPDSVFAVELKPDTASILVGDSVTFTARAIDRFGNTIPPASVTVRSLTPALTAITTTKATTASVTAIVRGLAAGNGLIVAEQGQSTDTVRVSVLSRVSAGLALGAHHTCALNANGKISCWGAVPAAGAGGDACGAFTCLRRPQAIASSLRFEAIAAGGDQTCALSDNAVYCWGRGGAVPGFESTTPQRVPGNVGVIDLLSVGRNHACVTTNGVAFCWGDNSSGELGTGDRVTSSSPREVLTTERFQYLSPGPNFTCGLTVAFSVHCWGANSHGELGRGTVSESEPVPAAVSGLTNMVDLSKGAGSHVCVRWLGYTSLLCWGNNDFGQIAGGLGPYSATPRAPWFSGFFFPATTLKGTCISDGKAGYCFGIIGHYQYSGFVANFRQMTAGDEHVCAFVSNVSNSGYFCWGDNSYGALGDGTLNSSRVPVAIVF